MAITQDQIREAAAQIAETGETPTLAAIRDRIGGSYTTISPVLREWKAQQHANDAPIADPVPESVSNRLASVAAELWGEALTLANGRLSAEREALESTRAEMESEQAEAVELADNLAAEIETLKIRASDALDEAQRIREEFDLTSKDFNHYQAESQARIDKIEAEHSQAQQALVTEKERREELRSDLLREQERREQQVEQNRIELDRAAQRLKEQAEKHRAEADSLRRDADEIRTARDAATKELAEAQATAKAEAQAGQGLQAEINRLNKTLEQSVQAAALARENAADLGGQLKASSQQIEKLIGASKKG